MIAAIQALERLKEGNARFVAGIHSDDDCSLQRKRQLLVSGQEPCAIILGCSDSRVPAEIVFDQGLGDLFVIRVAGNIVAPSLIGSIEFAAERFGTRLVVVLGHSNCGAILATLEQLERPEGTRSPNLRSIVKFVQPSLEPLLATDLRYDRELFIREAVRANIRTSVRDLELRSEILRDLVERDGLMIVGAEYSLETGEVRFLPSVD